MQIAAWKIYPKKTAILSHANSVTAVVFLYFGTGRLALNKLALKTAILSHANRVTAVVFLYFGTRLGGRNNPWF